MEMLIERPSASRARLNKDVPDGSTITGSPSVGLGAEEPEGCSEGELEEKLTKDVQN